MSKETKCRNIVIVGGGVIGTTTAYFLSRHPAYSRALHSITIIEATSIGSAASGKAGGLLALWAYPSCIVPLSYRLHAELAARHNGAQRWGYRTLHCASLCATGNSLNSYSESTSPITDRNEWKKLPKISTQSSKRKMTGGVPKNLNWIDGDSITGYTEIGTPENTAQVDPYKFTASMAELAAEAGVRVIIGCVTKIIYNSDSIRGVNYETKDSKKIEELEATDIILAAGPWTPHIFPSAPIEATKAHSVVIKAQVTPHALFTKILLPNDLQFRRHGAHVMPEIYPRPDGTIYACGEADSSIDLPQSSDLVTCDDNQCQDIIDYISTISVKLGEGSVLKKQACYLPSVKNANASGPIIGKTRHKGLFLATGHTCWGIQNSCATGKLMSEFIYDGEAKSASIETLDPKNFL